MAIINTLIDTAVNQKQSVQYTLAYTSKMELGLSVSMPSAEQGSVEAVKN